MQQILCRQRQKFLDAIAEQPLDGRAHVRRPAVQVEHAH
jgi:hypothetical protein